MRATYIIAGLGLLFLVLGALRLGTGGARHPQARVWLLIGAIFTVVATWLWLTAS